MNPLLLLGLGAVAFVAVKPKSVTSPVRNLGPVSASAQAAGSGPDGSFSSGFKAGFAELASGSDCDMCSTGMGRESPRIHGQPNPNAGRPVKVSAQGRTLACGKCAASKAIHAVGKLNPFSW